MSMMRKTILVAVLLSQVACGTLLYPERRNQRSTGQVDYGVVIMDAAWMLLFVIPGVIALAVDFSTGAIYLPRGKKQLSSAAAERREAWLPVAAGSTFEVRAPAGAVDGVAWEFALHRAEEDAAVVSWAWNQGSDLTLAIPAGLDAGSYALSVRRNGEPVGDVPVRVSSVAAASRAADRATR